MSDQGRRIRVDWARFEAAGSDLSSRAEALGLLRDDLAAEIEPLHLAVEGGIVEYKRSLLGGAFRAIEEARYRSLTGAQVLAVAKRFAVFAWIANLQRLIADGTIVIRDRPSREHDDPVLPDHEYDVKAIISEIHDRVRQEHDLRTRAPVKNILMQLARYSRELEQFKEVTARTPADKRGSIAANFRRTTEEIFASIRRNYHQLLVDERRAVDAQPRNVLLRIPIGKLSGLFLRQARAAMATRSGLLFVREEQRGTRELLLELADHREPTLALVDEERRLYVETGGTEQVADEVARAFARELAVRVERETEIY